MIYVVKKKPVDVQAMQFTGELDNLLEIQDFTKNSAFYDGIKNLLLISTLEGVMHCRKGDWIIKGTAGEFYPVKNDIFQNTYTILGEVVK